MSISKRQADERLDEEDRQREEGPDPTHEAELRGFFEGHTPRECGEHRTVGPHRAWCHDCHEWCYPAYDGGCKGCELPRLRAEIERLQGK